MDWFFISLLCALSIAGADVLTKRYLAALSGAELLLVRLAVPGVLLLPLLIAYPLPPVPPAFWGWMALLIPLELVAMLLYMRAIRDSPLYLTLPYLAFTPVFNVLTGWLFLGEIVSGNGLLGVLLVMAGTWMLNAEQVKGPGLEAWLAPFRAVWSVRGSRLMLGVAAIYSFTSVMGKAAMEYATPMSFGPFYYAVIGTVVALGFLFLRPAAFGVLLWRPRWVLIVGGLMAVMVVTHFLAIALVEVAYMMSVKRTSLLFGILFGALLFREGHLSRHLFAGGLMVAGVALILL